MVGARQLRNSGQCYSWVVGNPFNVLFRISKSNRLCELEIKTVLVGVLALVFMFGFHFELQASTLSHIKKRGYLNCGISKHLPGFATADKNNNWTGLDVDFCRSVAAAIFNDPEKVKYHPLSRKDSISALQSGDIDLLNDSSSWSLAKDAGLGLNFVGVLYYDGQAFMVRKKLGVSSALELSGASICVNKTPMHELKAKSYFEAKNMPIKIITDQEPGKVAAAYEAGRCNVLTDNQSRLAAVRLMLKTPNDHLILPDIISKEPRGPIVRQGDDQWFNLIKWVLFAIINAEELGITKANISDMVLSNNLEVRNLLGSHGKFGILLGVEKDWVQNIIRAVGNIGEMYNANIGARSSLKIERGLNELWNNGGILYAPPVK